ncbi:hypothetical protein E2C01_022788 [Portunus trituberculatus]|uniref:Uncharacterized protein n=1 Tax=Portunus trituberculatus TaxID=210409 RepID=A0A5B7E870_PORTR|nr:hypothetical protein [Portunus trituberculatus]
MPETLPIPELLGCTKEKANAPDGSCLAMIETPMGQGDSRSVKLLRYPTQQLYYSTTIVTKHFQGLDGTSKRYSLRKRNHHSIGFDSGRKE